MTHANAIAWVNEKQAAVFSSPMPGRVKDDIFEQLFHDLASRWHALTAASALSRTRAHWP